jgi:hypothetical protein
MIGSLIMRDPQTLKFKQNAEKMLVLEVLPFVELDNLGFDLVLLLLTVLL